MERKGKIIALFIANALFVLATIGLIILASTNWGRGKKKDYDMSGVVFDDLTVEYDGKPHSIFATSLPEGVTASYENNDQIEIGTYTVTAHFYGDEERYNPIPDKTATLTVTKPAKSRILSATSFEIDETSEPPRIYCDVSNATEQIDLSDKITVMPNRTWKLFEDADGNTELTSKTMRLETGHNISYIIITDLINNTATYEVDVYRLDMKTYTFKNEGQIHASGSIEEKSQLASPENPEKPYYTFTGWAIEGSTDIVQFPYTVTEDITFVAQYTPTNYKITYYLNGGTNDARNPAFYNTEMSDIELLPATRDGYIFEGWYEDGLFEREVTVIESGSFGVKELYAKWTYGSEGLIYEQIGNEYKVIGYNGNAAEIIVPEEWKGLPVTAIGKGVFESCTNLEKLTIPFVGATKNGTANSHFGYIFGARDYKENSTCVPSSLKSVIITGGSTIGYGAFMYCASLESISIPESVTEVGNFVFEYCTNLTSVEFGKDSQLNAVSCGMFEKCTSLKNIKIPDSVTYINDNAFEYCRSLESVTFGENSQLNYIGELVFDACTNLKSIKIPDGVLYLGGYAFGLCTSLESVIFGEKSQLKYIDCWAFSDCSSLKSIKIPDSVTLIDMYAFEGCTSLEEITLPFVGGSADGKTASHFGYIFGAENSYSGNATYVPLSLKTVTITGGVSIKSYAFYRCANIQSIAIPDSVTSIGERAFYNCTSLERITFGENSKLTDIGLLAFSGCAKIISLTIPDGVTFIDNSAFLGLSNLTAVHITDIASWCNIELGNYDSNPLYYAQNLYLNNKLVTQLEVPDSVTSISGYVFFEYTKLTSIKTGANSKLASIGICAFKSCTNLVTVEIPDSVTSIASAAFNSCSSLNAVYITDIASWCKIKFNNFDSNPLYYAKNLYLNNKLVTVLDITENVTSIGSYAFYGYEKLTGINAGANSKLASVGVEAFKNCTNLVEVVLPDSLTSVSNSMFYECSSLVNVTIPDSLTSVSNSMFYKCSSLVSITIPDSVTSIGECAFYDCIKLTNVKFGESSKLISIDRQAFYHCENLLSITIPEGVTTIGVYAFEFCAGLTSITIPASVTSIDFGAFQYCTNLTSVVFKRTSGWKAGDKSISSSNLENSATAAKYLRDTYSATYWKRTEAE